MSKRPGSKAESLLAIVTESLTQLVHVHALGRLSYEKGGIKLITRTNCGVVQDLFGP